MSAAVAGRWTGLDVLGRVALALALAGVAIAGYLTVVHYTGLEAVCGVGAGGGCEKVQTSRYSELGGVPVALLGLLGYLAITAALVGLRGEAGLLAPAGLAVAGAAFSGYLQYRSLVTIGATCIWCVASASVMLTLAAVTVTRAAAAP